MDKIERLQALLALQLGWVRAADAKVTAIFAVNTAMLGVIAGLATSHEPWQVSEVIFASLSALPLLISVLSLACALFPRLDGPKGSNIYFAGIASQDREQYVNCLIGEEVGSLDRDYAYQIHRNSEIALEKYKFVKCSFVATFVSLPFWLLAIYYLYGA